MAEKRELSEGIENIDPNAVKKRRLSLSLKKKQGSRFGTTSKEQLESMSSYTMPKNSAVSSTWAIKNLSDWWEEHNDKNPNNLCPKELLSPNCSKEMLNEWLCSSI